MTTKNNTDVKYSQKPESQVVAEKQQIVKTKVRLWSSFFHFYFWTDFPLLFRAFSNLGQTAAEASSDVVKHVWSKSQDTSHSVSSTNANIWGGHSQGWGPSSLYETTRSQPGTGSPS